MMVTEDQHSGPVPTPPRGHAFRAAAVAVVLVSLSGMGFLMLRLLQPAGPAGGPATPEPQRPRLFFGWPRDRKPDLVLVLSGQQHGYVQPCGCSNPQYGGLERRYIFMQGLVKERGWPLLAVDLGDVAQKSGPQAKLKYVTSMKALKILDYSGVGVGLNEMSLPLIEALGEYALNNPEPPVLVANLKDPQNYAGMVQPFVVGGKVINGKGSEPKVAVAAVVGPSVAGAVRDPAVGFLAVKNILPGVLQEMDKQKPEFRILLYQGTPTEAAACAKEFPQFHLIVALSEEEEPPEAPQVVGNTQIRQVGHKGRSLGVLGLYRNGTSDRSFDLHYQLVALGPEYETPPGKDQDNPILELLEKYTQDVKKGNYLAHYTKAKHPLQLDPQYEKAEYIGSEKCKSCHKESYKIWKNSPHSHAYQTLVTAKRPSLRQFDGECVSCHVTGFKYATGFADAAATPALLDNGCENCHGPGSIHVLNANRHKVDTKLNDLMNPFREPPNETAQQKKVRMDRLGRSCMECHDTDNDVHWDIKKWVEGKIAHKEPKENPAPAAAEQEQK